MLCVGKIIPGERTVKRSKTQSHVESWRQRGGDHTEEWSGGKKEVQSQPRICKKSTKATTEPNQLFWKVVTG